MKNDGKEKITMNAVSGFCLYGLSWLFLGGILVDALRGLLWLWNWLSMIGVKKK